MLYAPEVQTIAAQYAPVIEELRDLARLHGLSIGLPEDLTAFPLRLSQSFRLRSETSGFFHGLQHQHPDLDLDDALAILLLAIGGNTVLRRSPAVEEALSLTSGFLSSLGGWPGSSFDPVIDLDNPPDHDPRFDLRAAQAREAAAGLPSREATSLYPPDEDLQPETGAAPPEPYHADLLAQAEEGNQPEDSSQLEESRKSEDHQPDSSPEPATSPDPESRAGSGDASATGTGPDNPEPPAPRQPDLPLAAIAEALARLERGNLELRLHLDSIDQRISRMEPLLEVEPPSAPHSSHPEAPPDDLSRRFDPHPDSPSPLSPALEPEDQPATLLRSRRISLAPSDPPLHDDRLPTRGTRPTPTFTPEPQPVSAPSSPAVHPPPGTPQNQAAAPRPRPLAGRFAAARDLPGLDGDSPLFSSADVIEDPRELSRAAGDPAILEPELPSSGQPGSPEPTPASTASTPAAPVDLPSALSSGGNPAPVFSASFLRSDTVSGPPPPLSRAERRAATLSSYHSPERRQPLSPASGQPSQQPDPAAPQPDPVTPPPAQTVASVASPSERRSRPPGERSALPERNEATESIASTAALPTFPDPPSRQMPSAPGQSATPPAADTGNLDFSSSAPDLPEGRSRSPLVIAIFVAILVALAGLFYVNGLPAPFTHPFTASPARTPSNPTPAAPVAKPSTPASSSPGDHVRSSRNSSTPAASAPAPPRPEPAPQGRVLGERQVFKPSVAEDDLTSPGRTVAPTFVPGPVMDGYLLAAPHPDYPSEAGGGTVVLEAMISRNGEVESLKALGGSHLLRDTVTQAVQRWQYRPFRVNGRPVEVRTIIRVDVKEQSGTSAPN